MILTIFWVIWRDLQKVQVQDGKVYGSYPPHVMVDQYLWGTLQSYMVMEEFLRYQFSQKPEVLPPISLYIFEDWAPRSKSQDTRQKIEAQSNMWRSWGEL